MKALYKMFLEESGLTVDEANAFLKIECDKLNPPDAEPTEEEIAFNKRLAKEAKEWKRNNESC